MRIGIEACTWANRRGYGRFTRRLVSAMIRGFPEHDFTLVLDQATAASGQFPDRAELLVVGTKEQQIQAASADGARRVGDLWRMGRAVARSSFDVFFFPTRYSYFPVFGRTPIVVAFHDATAELHPKLIFPGARSRLFWRIKSRLALWQTERLLTVSEDARRQLADVFSYPIDRIDVISEGPDSIFRQLPASDELDQVRGTYRLPANQPLVLYVGGISPHKNLQGLLRAMKAVPDPWHLVVVGDYKGDSFWGCHQELVELQAELGLDRRVSFTGYVPDSDLVRLYNVARLLVLPSMSEGFGLPVIEAMACGLPVAASARGSLPEVLGDAGVLFDPEHSQEMTAAIAGLLRDEGRRLELREHGLERARLYTWERGAQQTVAILEGVARR